jgi:hypothetical protein
MMKKLAVGAFALAIGLLPAAGRSDQMSAQAAVKQIDTECSAIQNAIMALKPIHLVLASGKWNVVSEGDYVAAERTHASITFADVWKQGSNPAWVHTHSFNAAGDQKATQLCFRQADGTLERAREAKTLEGLDSASAEQAYFASDGTVLQQTSMFVVNDPAVVKKVADLPFYSQLP